jgi:uncharacterized LabA/DUF88 family protein
MVEEIIYGFIDSQNLNLGTRSAGWILDFKKFRIYLKEKYRVKKAFLFIGYIETNRKLYEYLEKSGYILIFKPVLAFKGESSIKTKGNVDAELVLYTMIEYCNYDKAIIVSGDGDFFCLANYLDQNKKLKHIIIPNRNAYSSLLLKFRKDIRFMDDLKKKLEK